MHSRRTSVALTLLAIAASTFVLAGNVRAQPTDPDTPALAAAGPHGAPAATPKKLDCTAPSQAQRPRVVFQVNDADDTALVLRVVANYLLAEPDAEIAVVGYGTGAEFMLKDARDANGKPYAEQLQRLTERGVAFKVCNNWLRSRNLTASAVTPLASVVPSAVIEILRLQTAEGFAYFRP